MMIESFEGKENSALLTKLDTMTHTSTDESDARIGVNGHAATGYGAGNESSDSGQQEESVYPTRARRAAVGARPTTALILRCNLRCVLCIP